MEISLAEIVPQREKARVWKEREVVYEKAKMLQDSD